MSLFRKKIVEEVTFYDCDTLTTNLDFFGLCGGDGGHGAFLKLQLNSAFGFEINGNQLYKLELVVRGDAEIKNFIRMCRFVSEVLQDATLENIDKTYDDAINDYRFKNYSRK